MYEGDVLAHLLRFILHQKGNSIMSTATNSSLKSILSGSIVFVMAVAGVYVGMSLKESSSAPPVEPYSEPTSKLASGMTFPDVQVMDESSKPVMTSDMLAGKGGVILFMELGCPPCVEMTEKWVQAIKSGEAKDISVYGIAINLPMHIYSYRMKKGISFPIYSDSAGVFINQYDVTSYPMQVVVGKSGVIRYTNFDSREELAFDLLREQLDN
jgi:peroxiredoxin